MLTYLANDGEDPRRARRAPAPGGLPARDDDLRPDARGARGASRWRPEAIPEGGGRRAKRTQRHLGADRGDPRRRGGTVPLVVDSGPLFAYLDADDSWHTPCLELLESHPGPLIVPVLCVAEVTQLAAARLGSRAELRFLEDL